AERLAHRAEAQLVELRIGGTAPTVFGGEVGKLLQVTPFELPGAAQRGQAHPGIGGGLRIGPRSGGVVDPVRWVLDQAAVGVAGRLERNFAHRHPQVGPGALDVNFARGGERSDRNRLREGGGWSGAAHRPILTQGRRTPYTGPAASGMFYALPTAKCRIDFRRSRQSAAALR